MRSLSAILFLLCCNLFVQAQDLTITKIDSSRFPEIRVSVLYTGKARFDKSELSLSQFEQAISYNLSESSPGSAPERGRSLFFLLEASGNTYGKALKDLREGLSASIDNLEVQDLVNGAWFGSEEADSVSGGMQLLYESFNNKHETLKADLNTKVIARQDTAHKVDLYKSILSALDYIGSQKELPRNRLFVVLSTGRNNSKSPVSSTECVNRAKELGIPVYSVTYLPSDTAYAAGMMMNRICIRTGGKNIHARSQVEIINALSDFFSIPPPAYLQEAAYDLVFTVQPENGINQARIELNFRGARQIISVSDGKQGGFLTEDYKLYLWISIGILGLVVVIMILVNVLSGKNNKNNRDESEEDNHAPVIQFKQEQAEKKPAVSISEEKPFVEKTKQPGPVVQVPGQPVVLVSLNGRTSTFQLNKSEITIGRHETNDISLSEQTVTGRHAVIQIKGKEISISDLGSTNGTFVNGVRIRNKQIVHGDKIRLGKVELTLKV